MSTQASVAIDNTPPGRILICTTSSHRCDRVGGNNLRVATYDSQTSGNAWPHAPYACTRQQCRYYPPISYNAARLLEGDDSTAASQPAASRDPCRLAYWEYASCGMAWRSWRPAGGSVVIRAALGRR